MPLLFPGPYFPKTDDNLMQKVGDTSWVRNDFLNNRTNNLELLLRQRYTWMNKFIKDDSKGVELGSGAGFSSLYLNNNAKVFQSDCQSQPWLGCVVDGLTLPFKENSLDFIIIVDVMHHLAQPLFFFKEAQRVLKKNGLLIIKDSHASLSLRAVLRLMHHEGYSFNVDPFNPKATCNDPNDPWSGNNAIADIFYKNKHKLKDLTGFETLHHKLTESLTLYLSGGVSAKSKTYQFSNSSLKTISKIDRFLSNLLPSIFPTGMEWVLKLNKPPT